VPHRRPHASSFLVVGRAALANGRERGRERIGAACARQCIDIMRVHERHESLDCARRDMVGDRRPFRIHRSAGHFDAPEQGDGVELLDHEIRGDAPDVLVKDLHRRGHVELLEIQERKVPGVVRMDRTCAGRKQRHEGLHAREPLARAALADEHVGKGVLRPRVSRLERERAFRARFSKGVVGAQLARESGHGEKIGIAGMRSFEPIHMRAEARGPCAADRARSRETRRTSRSGGRPATPP
jgi:hypothetical protein